MWRYINEDQLRLFKAAVQSNDQAKLVRETLAGFSKGASFALNRGGTKMKRTFKRMFKSEKFVQWLQAGFKDEKSVQSLQSELDGEEIERKLSLLLSKSGVDMMEIEGDVVRIVHKIPVKENLHLLKTFMADSEGVKIFRSFFERLTLLDDMLSSTELDTVPILKEILEDQNKVQFLKEVVKDKVKLESFRIDLADKKKMNALWDTLGDTNPGASYDQVIKDINQVFSLRVATKDDVRARLFRAALEDKQQVEKFVNALEKKKLANIFISLLQDEEKLSWLNSAVANDYYPTFELILQIRDREKLAEEMLQYLNALEPKENLNP
ncbi:hypothetical protein Plhal304r1_c017g0061201 [Plasmopara halstedii]